MAHVRRKKMTIDPETLLEGLNPEQRQVVEFGEGAALVLAGAGAGKTRALVHRVAMLTTMGIGARQILAVTFSKKAADEMNERLHTLGIGAAAVGTWHALAYRILREERREFCDWEIDDRSRFRFIVKDVLGWQGMSWDSADLGVVLSYIGLCKARCAEPGTEAAEAEAQKLFDANPCNQTNPRLLTEAYQRATAAQLQRQLMTFDDQLLWTWRLLRDDPDACARWAARFAYVLQDEAQDCNPVQSEIAEMLARPHGNYMMVGDPAQSIYGFRGAAPEKFTSFETEWAPVVIRMNRNYRSGAEVIEAANRLTEHMAEGTHLGVGMLPERGTHAAIELHEHDDLDAEGEGVARACLEAHEDGVRWGDMACLYRTNAQSRGVEEACLRNRIPYVVIGGTNFYQRREVKDLIAYLRVAAGTAEWDDVRRSINSPWRFLGRAFQSRVQDAHAPGSDWLETVARVAEGPGLQSRQRTSVFEWAGLIDGLRRSMAIAGNAEPPELHGDDGNPYDIPMNPASDIHAHRPAALLERIITETDYMRFITRDEGAESTENNRVSNVRELVRATERFRTTAEFLEYVDTTVQAARKATREGGDDRVTLCSLHRSKGLEWPLVAVIGCNDQILPHGRSDDLEEERRLFYVGITRARDILHVSHVRAAAFGARVVALEPSPFLAEAGFELEGNPS